MRFASMGMVNAEMWQTGKPLLEGFATSTLKHCKKRKNYKGGKYV